MCEEKEGYGARDWKTTKEFLLKVVMPFSLGCLMVMWGIWVLEIVLGI